jgi:6-phosphogluconolactonase
MTFTFSCINQARHIAIYVLGASKKKIVTDVLFAPKPLYPIQSVGTPTHKALWILDETAAEGITNKR